MIDIGDKWLFQTPAAGGGWTPWRSVKDAFEAIAEEVTPVQAEPHPDYKRQMGSYFRLYDAQPKGTMTTRWVMGAAGWNRDDVITDVTNMRTAFQHVRLKIEGHQYEYECIMTGWQVTDPGVDGYIRATVKFDVLQMLPPIVSTIDGGTAKILINAGTVPVGADVTVEILEDGLLVTVCGATLINPAAGETWEFRGRSNGQVYVNGEPALNRTGNYTPPVLTIGDNHFEAPAGTRMTVTWQPIYV